MAFVCLSKSRRRSNIPAVSRTSLRTWGLAGMIACSSLGLAPHAMAQLGIQPSVVPPRGASNAILERTNPRDLTLKAYITLRMQSRDQRYGVNVDRPFPFDSAALVFPLVPETSSSTLAQGAEAAKLTLKVDGQVVPQVKADGTPRPPLDLVDNAPPGTRYARVFFAQKLGSRIELEVVTRTQVYRTVYNDALAKDLKWPAKWPDAAEAFLNRPQWGIELDPKGPVDLQPIKDFVTKATGGNDPKKVPPATLARFLAGEVVGAIQLVGTGMNSARTGELEGFNLQGVVRTLQSGRGSSVDLACLLTAVYRQAGLPARTVVGYRWYGARDVNRRFATPSASDLTAWVEFALVDDRGGGEKLVWVPVDIAGLRGSTGRPPPLERPWEGFGTVPDLEAAIPIAFDFHPPLDAVSHGSPALYGWLVSPNTPPEVVQVIRFNADATPIRGTNAPDVFTPPKSP